MVIPTTRSPQREPAPATEPPDRGPAAQGSEPMQAKRLKALVHASAFLRKETVAVVRQPRLVGVLVIGPFLLLLFFALGYDQEQTVLRTAFVGPDDQAYVDAIDRFSEDLDAYIEPEGYSSDVVGAQQRLVDGEIDLVVIFPEDPAQTVLDGRRAEITVLHDKLDPIQQTAVEVSVEVAVRELNAIVVEEVIRQTQDRVESASTAEVADEVDAASDGRARPLVDYGEALATLEPAVIARPFSSDTENLLRLPTTLNDFFAPAAIALLVQHMALTFAALSLVRDRQLGLFELFQVGSLKSGRILFGKYGAHLLIVSAVAAVLLAAVTYGIGVPFRGPVPWAAAGVFGLVTASAALGMVLSLSARSDSQAVQYAMLVLLASLFFGGFLLDLDALNYPVKLISLVIPVTYGTSLLRDVMLRGSSPDLWDVVGLASTSLVYSVVALRLMARRLKQR